VGEFRVQGGADYVGVYPIGEVYARFWMLAGTSVGSFTPKNLASYLVQRGVGISRTRV
jgi:hypothetical protein